jgi:hypothetical protein
MSLKPARFEDAKIRYKPMHRSPMVNKGGSGLKRKSGMKWGKISKAAKNKRYQVLRADSIWSQAVRARDDHRCQRCGKRDEKNNHAHHVAPRSRRPDLKRDLNNGKTVCPECHTWIHSHPIEAEAAGLLSSETYEKARKAIADETIEGRSTTMSSNAPDNKSSDLSDFLREQMKDPEFAAEYQKVDKEEGEKLTAAFKRNRCNKRNFEHQQLKDAIVDEVRREGRKGMLTPWIQEAREALIEFEKREVQP